MNKLKLILMALGLLFAAIVIYYVVGAVVGVAFTLLFYAVVIGAIAFAGAAAYRYLTKPKQELPLLEENSADRELSNAQNVLEEYRQKVLRDRN